MTSNSLIDRLGRRHTDLRISVTDRCNIRCWYCMPVEGVQLQPRSGILTFEEIVRVAEVAISLGVRQIRLTGGEPLVRRDIPELVRMLARLPGLDDLALTTNGIRLAELAEPLRQAGLQRVNISLDTLSEDRFREIARRPGLQRVLEGIAAAQTAGFQKIRLNAVSLRGINESEIVELVAFALHRQLELRFIEFMPLDAEAHWESDKLLTGAEVRQRIEAEFGPLVPVSDSDPHQPSCDFEFVNRTGRIGFINPVSEPFCGACDRLRLTADGKLRNCLFSLEEFDARAILRGGGNDQALIDLFQECVQAKRPGHGIDDPEFQRPHRAMYQIGG